MAACLAFVVLLPSITATAQSSPPKLFEEIAKIDRFSEEARAALSEEYVPKWEDIIEGGKFFFRPHRRQAGTGIIIPHLRQLWQIYWDDAPNFNVLNSAALVRDLDTLKIIKAFPLPGEVNRATKSGGGGDWAHAIDEVNDRLFLVTTGDRFVMEVDLKTFAVKNRPLPSLSGFNIVSIGAVTYDPYRDDLVFLYGGPGNSSVVNTNTFLYLLDLSAQQNSEADLAKVYQMKSCSGPLMSTDSGGTTLNWETLVTPELLYVPCSRAGHIGTVVRMSRPGLDNPNPREDYIAGPMYPSAVVADQKAERLFFMTTQGEIWPFDAGTMSYIGVVATVYGSQIGNPGMRTGWGLDPQTGRFFFLNERNGLGLVEGRFFPVPQALVDQDLKVMGLHRILSDPKTNNLFVLEGAYSQDIPRDYKIYRTTPNPAAPLPPNPDLNTADVEEKAGLTEARFFSKASGYGFRSIWAQGWAAVIPAPPAGELCPTCPINQGIGNGRGGFVDREFYLGRVFNTEYDTGSTSARAIGAGVDEYSRQEFNWNRNEATCSSEEGGTQKTAHGKPDDLGPSTVHCPLPGGELRAYAEGRGQSGVNVGKAWTETTITKLNRGVLSQTTAVAQDITIADFIHIGEIRSTAKSLAHGRPSRKDMSTHTVAIKAVRIGDGLICDQCTDNDAVARALTAAGGPLRMQFRVGTQDVSGLDLALLRGSPGGALTAVQKSEARQAQDRALVADTTTDVPGMEMTVFNDNVTWGRARQIYQFAGVSTVANYNIVPLPKAGEFSGGDDSSLLPVDDVLGGEGPTLGLTEAADDSSDGGGVIGAIKRAITAIARGLRLFLSNPRQFLLLLTAWALFGLAPYLSRRRRLLDIARAA